MLSSSPIIDDDTICRENAPESLGTYEIDVLLLPGFSFISFASAVEPLRMANKVLGHDHFRYRLLSIDGADVVGSNGAQLRVTSSIEAESRPDMLIICSSDGIEKVDLPANTRQSIRRMAHTGVKIAGICTGAFVLARLGLLSGRKCTIHWEYAEIFRESFPSADLKDHLFEEDGRILTCAGGSAAFDMILHIIDRQCGTGVRMKVVEIAIQGDVRAASQDQRVGALSRVTLRSEALAKCVSLMQENLEDPLDIDDLCSEVGLSRRQIERLFDKYMRIAPMAYYRQIRLNLARRLIEHSKVPVNEVAIATGFVSASHFSRVYRQQFGANPGSHRVCLP